MAVNQTVLDDTDRICAGHVNGNGEANSGDNTTAELLAELADKDVSFLRAKGTTTDTLGGYFSSLVSKVGADSAAAETAYEYSSALASDLV